MKLILPLSTFHIIADYKHLGLGLGGGGDFTTNQTDCADQASECDEDGMPWRAFRIDLCPQTNEVISCVEVTGLIASMLNDRQIGIE